MSSSRVKTRETKSGEIIAYSEAAVRQNLVNVEYVKTSLACKRTNFMNQRRNLMFFNQTALAGCTAGILGLTGLLGFVFYLVSLLGFFGLLIVKTGTSHQKYFISRKSLLTNGFLGGLSTYTLFWTFIYGMVHVY